LQKLHGGHSVGEKTPTVFPAIPEPIILVAYCTKK